MMLDQWISYVFIPPAQLLPIRFSRHQKTVIDTPLSSFSLFLYLLSFYDAPVYYHSTIFVIVLVALSISHVTYPCISQHN